MAKPEGAIETYFINEVEAYGGKTYKFTSPGNRGVPDQIAIFKGKTYYVEIKAPGEKPRKSQLAVHKEFAKHGVTVYTVDTKSAVDAFIKNILKAKKRIELKSSTPSVILDNFFKTSDGSETKT